MRKRINVNRKHFTLRRGSGSDTGTHENASNPEDPHQMYRIRPDPNQHAKDHALSTPKLF